LQHLRPIRREVLAARFGVDRPVVNAQLAVVLGLGERADIEPDLLVCALDDDVPRLAVVPVLRGEDGFVFHDGHLVLLVGDCRG
jgi:hypothetical protein